MKKTSKVLMAALLGGLFFSGCATAPQRPAPKAMAPMLPTKALKTSTNQFPGRVTLAWNHSTSDDVVGYRIYQGTLSEVYSVMHNIPTRTNQVAIYNLEWGKTYYFAATAYNAAGVESVFSNELETTITPRTNFTLTVTALIPPDWLSYTNLPPLTNPPGTGFFRTSSTNDSTAIQQAKSPAGPWTDRMIFAHTNSIWKVGITRTNW